MKTLIEHLIVELWNTLAAPRAATPPSSAGVLLGSSVIDGQVTRRKVFWPADQRPRGASVTGRNGTGKSRFGWSLIKSDIAAQRGFIVFDFHSETKNFTLSAIAEEEQLTGRDLSSRVIVISPADAEWSVGWNFLEHRDDDSIHVQVAEITEILKRRYHTDFGARTEELLRNALYLLAVNGLTLVELTRLLTDGLFRTTCLAGCRDAEVTAYFRDRFDQASEAMQGVMREPILNKISAFTGNPRFRHIIGQSHSTFSLSDAIDEGYWVVVDVPKAVLGEQAATFASLFLTKVKNAIFSRRTRRPISVYLDEVQNFIVTDDIDTMLSEFRKWNVSCVLSNQYLQQLTPQLQASIQAIGTHICFQLSPRDAETMAAMLDGGKRLAELLKNLPLRHMVIKTAHGPWCEVLVPHISMPRIDWADLYRRCCDRWARRRVAIEAQIRDRNQRPVKAFNTRLHDWT